MSHLPQAGRVQQVDLVQLGDLAHLADPAHLETQVDQHLPGEVPAIMGIGPVLQERSLPAGHHLARVFPEHRPGVTAQGLCLLTKWVFLVLLLERLTRRRHQGVRPRGGLDWEELLVAIAPLMMTMMTKIRVNRQLENAEVVGDSRNAERAKVIWRPCPFKTNLKLKGQRWRMTMGIDRLLSFEIDHQT